MTASKYGSSGRGEAAQGGERQKKKAKGEVGEEKREDVRERERGLRPSGLLGRGGSRVGVSYRACADSFVTKLYKGLTAGWKAVRSPRAGLPHTRARDTSGQPAGSFGWPCALPCALQTVLRAVRVSCATARRRGRGTTNGPAACHVMPAACHVMPAANRCTAAYRRLDERPCSLTENDEAGRA